MVIVVLVSLLAVAGFGLALWKSGVMPVAKTAVSTAFSGLSVMMDRELDDDAKEAAVRRAAFSLLKAAVSIAARFVCVLATAAVPILIADLAGIVRFDAVTALMLRPDYIVIVSVAAIIATKIAQKVRGGADDTGADQKRYPASDRFLHALAFAGPGVQKAVSRLEDWLVPKAAVMPTAPPIFVTSIARGGTTALLKALHDMPDVATHTYRDMPFVTAPALWHKLSGGAKRQVARKQRAHGDGLEIDLDSPEAFEEVLWKMFWPEKYRGAGIDM